MPFAAFFVAVCLVLCIFDAARKAALCILLGAAVGMASVLYTANRLERKMCIRDRDKTPFYAEMGGQAADHGTLNSADCSLRVLDVKKTPKGYYCLLYTSRCV